MSTELPTFILVEDDDLIEAALRLLVRGWRFKRVNNVNELLASDLHLIAPQLIVMDLCHPGDPEGSEAIASIPKVRSLFRGADLVIQSGLNDVLKMRQCIQNGAAQFILKEHLSEEFPLLLERHKEFFELRQELDKEILGESSVMRQLKRDLMSLRLEATVDVLLEGETGTGKELCAKALHSGGPLVSINVSAIPPELFESEFFGSEKGAFTGAHHARPGHLEMAGSGTLFLDEVQNLSLAHQAKLLRVLETRSFQRVGSSTERPFRARVVSATNRSLKQLVEKSLFREDLYFRLAPITVQVPPLRLRGADIALLAQTFLRDMDHPSKKRFSPAALTFLEKAYDWPGNVRELRGLLRMLVIKTPIPIIDAPEIQEALHLAQHHKIESFKHSLEQSSTQSQDALFSIDWSLGFDENIEKLEGVLIRGAVKRSNKTANARDVLKIARSRFYEKLKQFKVDSDAQEDLQRKSH